MNTILHPKIKMNIEEKAFQPKLHCIIFVSVIFHYSFIAFFLAINLILRSIPSITPSQDFRLILLFG